MESRPRTLLPVHRDYLDRPLRKYTYALSVGDTEKKSFKVSDVPHDNPNQATSEGTHDPSY
jgi:hypothetical protein